MLTRKHCENQLIRIPLAAAATPGLNCLGGHGPAGSYEVGPPGWI